MRAHRITDSIAYHAEGPCWWEATGRLRFVDMLAGAVVELDEAAPGGHRRLPVGSAVASVIRPRVGGGAIVATEHGISLSRREDLTAPRPFVSIDPAAGHPDGLCVDADGGVWVALNGGAAVHRYAPDGALDAVVELPVRQVTACTFGGDDYATLFITTSREDLPDDVEPAAGSIFAVAPGVRGLAPLPFGR
ncbi:MAG: SMP-30/gluconolactonase/LRE family protein [Actinomyces succiniciruminis]|nr:SMP-30/gluconolactonase/LRE family protein [Actinomyces succiniciruminis]